MDTEFARTFLAIVDTGSFVRAAERVHLTQSTVSMRIKTLEDQIGRPLFVRQKGGVSLTPEGVKFQKHAAALVRTWEQARQELSLPPNYQSLVTVGSQYSLWDNFLLAWISGIRHKKPEFALRSVVGFSDTLMNWLADGTVDFAIMYRPERKPGFEIEPLFDDRLVMVSSMALSDDLDPANYIYVDWGPQFHEDHTLNFPELSAPGLVMDVGSLALKYLLSEPSFGYFPERAILDLADKGDIRIVPTAPVFTYPVYAVHPIPGSDARLSEALKSLKEFAKYHGETRTPGPAGSWHPGIE